MPRIPLTRLRPRKYYPILLVLMVALAFFLSFYGILPSSPTAKAQAASGQAELVLGERARQQIEALIAEKKARTPVQRKIDSHLLVAEKLRRGEPVAEGVSQLRSGVEVDAKGRVLVDISAAVSAELLKQIEKTGAEIVNNFPEYDAVRARVPLDQIESLGSLTDIHFIYPAFKGEFMNAGQKRTAQPTTGIELNDTAHQRRQSDRAPVLRSLLPGALTDLNGQKNSRPNVPTIGNVTSEGDTTHRADVARAGFAVDGTGVKIGVISNSIDHIETSQASGNLGTVFVLTGQSGIGTCGIQPCSGEGTAMLEIVHDLAPGAQLFFATANGGPAAFAQNIRNLRNVAHCDIIVDDFLDSIETPFQDGQTIPSQTNGGAALQAVNEVTADGAIYFSSAGNSGNLSDGTSGVWEGDFVDGGTFSINGELVGRIHSFGPSVFNTITSQAASENESQTLVTLFWSDPLGAAANDYDFYVLDPVGNVIDQGSNFQGGHEDPYEEGRHGLLGGERVVIVKFSGSGRFLHLGTARGTLSIATAGQVRGHSCAAAAFSVAATPAYQPVGNFPNPIGPYPNVFNLFNVSELFSSDGPRRLFFNANGSAITPGNFSSTGGSLRVTPDITAADGVTTSLPLNGGLNPFFGTSAAAPHAAAIAGLLKSLKPTLTPAQIRTALTSTAVDIETPGVDRTTGVGIVMAFEALRSVATPNLTPFKPTGWSDKIVVSNVVGTTIDSSPLRTTDTLFVDLAVINSGTTATGSGFFVKLFVDGVERTNFVSNPLPVNNFGFVLDQSIGSLSAGTHTIKIVADPTGAVPETNETDNEFTKTITVSAATAAAQFSAATASVSETLNQTTKVNLTVTRTGVTSGAASVNYATSNGTASDRSDYLATLGTLSFAAGETSKTISVFIVDDRFGEGPETFSVTLSNPIGCTLGSPSTITVTINSNESVNGTNPVKDASFNSDFFVREHYVDFFNREADASGLAFWKNQIDSCTTQACRELRRINVSAAFFVSIEFQQTGYLVERLYKAAYGNGVGNSSLGGNHTLAVPIVRFNEFLPDTQQIGRGVVIGAPGADLLLENNKQGLIAEFVQRARFLTAFPTSMTPAAFVDKLNTNAGAVLSSSERNQLVNDLTSGAKTRAQVLRAVAEDSDLFNAETNRAFVLAQYFGYLRRNPNDSPDADYTGYDFWLGKLNQFNGNFVNAEMVKAFILAAEYQQRFGP